MKRHLILFILLLFTLFLYGEKTVPLPDLVNPDSITVSGNQIYIAEGIHIYIYDLKDFKLKKKLGREGDGPQEFRLDVNTGVEQLTLDLQTGDLIVTSLGKVSIFDKKDGTYKSERKAGDQSRQFLSLGKGFAGQGNLTTDEKGKRFRAVNIYGADLKKVKEVFKVKHHFDIREGLRLLEVSQSFVTGGGRLFIAWEREFNIRVFDAAGNHLFNISREYEKVKVTEKHKQQLINYFKTSPRYKRIFEILRIKLIFPDSFAALMSLRVKDGLVYAITFRNEKQGFETFIYDIDGKFREKVFLPVKQTETFAPYPYEIKNGKLYQLVENDDETWELHISEIKG
ncbi:MAG: hypothetical protein GY950_19610 [bacterium]|nr:hypothetical protein [bacterium]